MEHSFADVTDGGYVNLMLRYVERIDILLLSYRGAWRAARQIADNHPMVGYVKE